LGDRRQLKAQECLSLSLRLRNNCLCLRCACVLASADEADVRAFINELSIMKKVAKHHVNVIAFIGCCTKLTGLSHNVCRSISYNAYTTLDSPFSRLNWQFVCQFLRCKLFITIKVIVIIQRLRRWIRDRKVYDSIPSGALPGNNCGQVVNAYLPV